MILPLLGEAALRSLLLGLCVWLVLRCFGVHDSKTQLISWTLVLLAAIAMPLLMQLHRFQPPAAQITLPDLPDMALWTPAATHVTPTPAPAAGPTLLTFIEQIAALSGVQILLAVYLAGCVFFLLRLMVGFAVTWKLTALARPVHDEWTAGHDVRVSDLARTPMTFCTTIVLPQAYPTWPTAKRRAVMAHEGAHVRHGDFYVHALSAAYRVLFWFNPLAWWLQAELAELAERVSDDAAVANLGDAPSYAEILLDISQGAQSVAMAVAMARGPLISRRVERVIDEDYAVPQLGRRRKLALVLSLLPLFVIAAGTGLKASIPAPLPVTPAVAVTKPTPSRPVVAETASLAPAPVIIRPKQRPVHKPAEQLAALTSTAPEPQAVESQALEPQADAEPVAAPQSCATTLPAAVPPAATPSTAAGASAARGNQFARAEANFRPLAERGNHQAEFLYGTLLMQDCTGLQDKAAAIMWYMRAADAGVTEAQNQLGQAYMRGNGVTQDDNKAFALLTKAAAAGITGAQVNLGALYLDGRGVARDYYKGMTLQLRAAEQGAPAALMNIAEGYSRGAALPRDNEKAAYFMNLALARAYPAQRDKFAESVDALSRVLSADALSDIAARSQHWSPGPGSLADVQNDLEKLRSNK